MIFIIILMLLLVPSFSMSNEEIGNLNKFLDYIESLKEFRTERYHKDIPFFTKEDYKKVYKGELVIKGIKENQNQKGLAMKIINIPIKKVWLIINDRNHFELYMPHIKESIILNIYPPKLEVYQYLDIPAPLVKPRNWVVDSIANTNLFKISNYKLWESSFIQKKEAQDIIKKLIDSGKTGILSKKEVLEAVIPDINLGSWLLIDLENGKTLLEYYSFNNPGGSIPDTLVNLTAKNSLSKIFQNIEKWGLNEADKHFKDNHEEILGPDGQMINPLSLYLEESLK